MKTLPYIAAAVIFVVFVAVFTKLEAQPPAEKVAEGRLWLNGRFWVSDVTDLTNNHKAFIVHDRKINTCLLVIQFTGNAPYGGVTSQPWAC